MKTRKILFLLLFMTSTVMGGATPGLALPVKVGDWISAYNGPGTTNGGEFNISLLSPDGLFWIPDIFRTFCLETNEYFNYYGQPLKINSITTYAQNGGAGGATNNMDVISAETAWLFYQFSTQSLFGYDYFNATERDKDANSLQYAIWLLEDEITSTNDSQALSWILEAQLAVSGGWKNDGKVFVMNMVKLNRNGTFSNAQDWLVAQPVPEPSAMFLFGTGLVAFASYFRRRFK
jgi:hypothetical protein